MLPASKRLGRTEFTAVFKSGQRFHSEHFTVIFNPTSATKASVVVSKKVAKLAVTRNRLRRRAYAVLETYFTTGVTGGLVVLYKTGSAKETRLTLSSELTLLLAKIPKSR